MKCTQCGHENREGVKFCEECGQPLAVKAARFCSNCGHENRAGVKFCEQCGTDLATGVLPAAAAGAQSAPPQRRRFNLLWLVIPLLLLVSSCGLMLVLGSVSTPDSVAPIIDPVIEKVREVIPWDELPEEINLGLIKIKLPNAAPPEPPKAPEPQPEDQAIQPPVQWGGCERNTTKALCEQGGGTWYQTSANMLDFSREKYCICQNDPQDPAQRDEAWCTSQGGTWMDPNTTDEQMLGFKECSFMNPCAGYTDQNSCEANNGYWNIFRRYCTCEQYGKYDEKQCNLPDNLEIGEMIYDSSTSQFKIDISSTGKWPEGSDWDVKVVKNNYPVGSLGCDLVGQNNLSCFYDSGLDDVDWLGSDLYLCRDNFCCVRVSNIGSDKIFGLTGDAPADGCCELVETEKVRQERDTEKGPLMLRFNLVCDQPWALAGDPIKWDAFIKEGFTDLWTSGTCSYYGDDTRQLECEADIQAEGQKKSRTKIVLDGCPSLDIEFQSPYYAPESEGCPSERKCGKTCCPPGCTCDEYDNSCSC